MDMPPALPYGKIFKEYQPDRLPRSQAYSHRSKSRKYERKTTMIDKNELCQKIQEIYPDIGECGIDVNVAFDQTNQRWTVDLKKEAHQLKTFLEEGDAELCLQGQQCVSLGLEIAQLRGNIERL
jgi:hypothetical protein